MSERSDYIYKVREAAGHMRTAIEGLMKADLKKLPVSFEHFPAGACGDTSLFLGAYLKELGCGDFCYMSGDLDECTHAWLEGAGLIIDITADQFNDFPQKVFVAEESKFHGGFKNIDSDSESVDLLLTGTGDSLFHSYKFIRSFLMHTL
ncbi:MAG: hypothetical protein RBR22_08165 [Desulfuromonas sp.]|nr:hypothetical protein [Desulfuromonas sp.]